MNHQDIASDTSTTELHLPVLPPQIVTALLADTSSHERNDEARLLRKRSERSRVGSRRRYRLTARDTGWITVSTTRAADDAAAPSTV